MGVGSEEVAIPGAQQCHQNRNVATKRCSAEVHVHGVESLEEAHEVHGADDSHEGQADGRIHAVASANPVPETKHVGGVDAELRHLVRIGRHSHEVLSHRGAITESINDPPLRSMGIGQGFLRGEGLGSDDEQGGCGIQAVQGSHHVGGIDVGDKTSRNAGSGFGT